MIYLKIGAFVLVLLAALVATEDVAPVPVEAVAPIVGKIIKDTNVVVEDVKSASVSEVSETEIVKPDVSETKIAKPEITDEETQNSAEINRKSRSIGNIARLLLGGNVPPDHPLVVYPETMQTSASQNVLAAVPMQTSASSTSQNVIAAVAGMNNAQPAVALPPQGLGMQASGTFSIPSFLLPNSARNNYHPSVPNPGQFPQNGPNPQQNDINSIPGQSPQFQQQPNGFPQPQQYNQQQQQYQAPSTGPAYQAPNSGFNVGGNSFNPQANTFGPQTNPGQVGTNSYLAPSGPQPGGQSSVPAPGYINGGNSYQTNGAPYPGGSGSQFNSHYNTAPSFNAPQPQAQQPFEGSGAPYQASTDSFTSSTPQNWQNTAGGTNPSYYSPSNPPLSPQQNLNYNGQPNYQSPPSGNNYQAPPVNYTPQYNQPLPDNAYNNVPQANNYNPQFPQPNNNNYQPPPNYNYNNNAQVPLPSPSSAPGPPYSTNYNNAPAPIQNTYNGPPAPNNYAPPSHPNSYNPPPPPGSNNYNPHQNSPPSAYAPPSNTYNNYYPPSSSNQGYNPEQQQQYQQQAPPQTNYNNYNPSNNNGQSYQPPPPPNNYNNPSSYVPPPSNSNSYNSPTSSPNQVGYSNAPRKVNKYSGKNYPRTKDNHLYNPTSKPAHSKPYPTKSYNNANKYNSPSSGSSNVRSKGDYQHLFRQISNSNQRKDYTSSSKERKPSSFSSSYSYNTGGVNLTYQSRKPNPSYSPTSKPSSYKSTLLSSNGSSRTAKSYSRASPISFKVPAKSTSITYHRYPQKVLPKINSPTALKQNYNSPTVLKQNYANSKVVPLNSGSSRIRSQARSATTTYQTATTSPHTRLNQLLVKTTPTSSSKKVITSLPQGTSSRSFKQTTNKYKILPNFRDWKIGKRSQELTEPEDDAKLKGHLDKTDPIIVPSVPIFQSSYV